MQAPTIYGSAPLPLRIPHPVLDIGTCYPFTITKNLVVWFTGDPAHRLFPTAGTAPTEVREVVPASGRTMNTTVVWASRRSPGVASCLFPHLPSMPPPGGSDPLPFVCTEGRRFWLSVDYPTEHFRVLTERSAAYRMLEEAGALSRANRRMVQGGFVTYRCEFNAGRRYSGDTAPPRIAPEKRPIKVGEYTVSVHDGPNAPTVDDRVGSYVSRREAEARHMADVEKIGKALMEEARERDWCEEYDAFVERVNETLAFPLPTRERELSVSVSFGFDHVVPVGQVIGLTGRVRDAILDALRSLGVDTEHLGIDAEIINDNPA